MALRFHFYNDAFGPLTVVNDPIGINDLTQTVKRSEQWEGVIFQIILDVEFIKEARDYLKNVYESEGGIDAIVHVALYNRHPNLRRWEHYASGQINFNKWELSEETVIVNIEQTGLQLNIINLMETDVDLEGLLSHSGNVMPRQILQQPVFHSKTLIKQSQMGPNDDGELPFLAALIFKMDAKEVEDFPVGTVMYTPIATSKTKFEEVDKTFPTSGNMIILPVQEGALGITDHINPNAEGSTMQYVDFLNLPERVAARFPQIEMGERADSHIDIQIRMRAKVFAASVGGEISVDDKIGKRLGRIEMIAWFERRSSVNEIIELVEIGRWDVEPEVNNVSEIPYKVFRYTADNIVSEIGDKFYVYITIRVYGRYTIRDGVGDGELHHDFYVQYDAENTWVNISAATYFEESAHQVHLIYEAIKRCCQYYTNVDDCFYSDLLGRTDIGYTLDGEGALISITSGNKLRGYTDKHVLINLKTILDFLKARFCIGFGFELINDKFKFRIEKVEHFYKKDLKVLSIGKVYPIIRRVLPTYFYNMVEIGYSGKLDIGQFNAIDEFNTFRRYTLPIINTKNKLILTTTLRASGNQIEYQRRLANTTIDSKLDDENFLVCLVREGDGYRTKSNQGYEKIVNVKFPSLQYNLDITPGRMLKAWIPVLGSCLIRSKSKLLKFSYGEVNYKVTSKKFNETTIIENGDVDLSGTEPICDNEEYGFNYKLSADQMKIVHSNPYAVFAFEDNYGNVMEGFINAGGGIENNPNTKVTEFNFRRVNRKVLSVSSERPRFLIPNFEYADLLDLLDNDDLYFEEIKKDDSRSSLLSRYIKFK